MGRRMRVHLRLAIVLATGLGCGRESPSVLKLGESPYYPLRLGTRWVYKGPDHQLLRRVVKHEVVLQTPCALVQTERDGQVTDSEHIFATDTGIFRLSDKGQELSEPMPVLLLPFERGRTWNVNFPSSIRSRSAAFRMDEGEVEVPAGKFRAITLEGEIREEGRRVVVVSYWFAHGTGEVKKVLRTDEKTTTYELEKFELGK